MRRRRILGSSNYIIHCDTDSGLFSHVKYLLEEFLCSLHWNPMYEAGFIVNCFVCVHALGDACRG